jgi:hypothetical protein
LSDTPAITELPKRRWYQYSLRTLFVVVTLAAIGFGLIVVPAQRQKRAVQAIRDAGGDVMHEDEPKEKRFLRAPEWLQEFLGDDYFKRVMSVNLAKSRITDDGLENLEPLNELVNLNLTNTHISDAGLKHIRGLTKLVVLDLTNTQITDAGLEHLNGLTSLEYLSISKTQISDAGCDQLRGLTKLSCIRLWKSRITDGGRAKLAADLPKCEIGY